MELVIQPQANILHVFEDTLFAPSQTSGGWSLMSKIIFDQASDRYDEIASLSKVQTPSCGGVVGAK